jgi:hypothetical protein
MKNFPLFQPLPENVPALETFPFVDHCRGISGRLAKISSGVGLAAIVLDPSPGNAIRIALRAPDLDSRLAHGYTLAIGDGQDS